MTDSSDVTSNSTVSSRKPRAKRNQCEDERIDRRLLGKCRKRKRTVFANFPDPLTYLKHTVEERIFDERFEREYRSAIQRISGKDFNLEYFLDHGFGTPLLFSDSVPPGMKIPSDLTAERILEAVGSSTRIEVIDCATQEGVALSFGDFVQYFTGQSTRKSQRTHFNQKIFNLIDLEVSHTSISDEITPPSMVQELDWASNVWPDHLMKNDVRIDGKPMYPKTQKYILMSKAGSYTDFHIDFGGSSVWYHLVSGKKLFFLIPPTPKNRNIFAQWVLSGQTDFLGDEIDETERLELNPGGWIHAVYTMDDSIVVGGNFLHIFSAEMQLDVALLESSLKVKRSIRYPFFNDLQWLAARRYLQVWNNCTHRVNPFELAGAKTLVEYLRKSLKTFNMDFCPVALHEIDDAEILLSDLEAMIATRKLAKPDSKKIFAFSHLQCHRKDLPDQKRKPKTNSKKAHIPKNVSVGTETEAITQPKPSQATSSTQTDDELPLCSCSSSVRPVYISEF